MNSAFIIPNYNQDQLLIECVDSIRKFHKETIIISDDASSQQTQDRISKILCPGTFMLKHQTNKGFGHNCNTAIELLDELESVVLINNDIVLTEPILEEFERIFKMDPKIGIIGMLLYYPNGYIQHAGHKIVDKERFHMEHLNYREDPKRSKLAFKSRYMISVTAAVVALRKSCIAQIGGFGEGYKNCYEDSELCLRAWHNDWRVYYTANISAIHKEGFTRGVTEEEKALKGYLKTEHESYYQYQKDVAKYNLEDITKKIEAANENRN